MTLVAERMSCPSLLPSRITAMSMFRRSWIFGNAAAQS